MSQRSRRHRRHSQLETLEKRNLLAFGLRSFLASSFQDASVPAAEVARSTVVKTAPIVAFSTLSAEAIPVQVAVAAPVSTFSAIQTMQSVESTPQAASLRTSADLESIPELDADSASPNSVGDSSAKSLPAESFNLRTLLLAPAQPNTSYQLTVAGMTLGTVTTDSAGNLSLKLTPVAGQRDEGTGSDGPFNDSLSKSPEQVSLDDSHTIDPASGIGRDSDFDEVNANADDLANVEASDSLDHSSDYQSYVKNGPTENSQESNGSEDSAGTLDDVEIDSRDASNPIDDSPGLSHELVDEVHSEVDDVDGLADDNSNGDDLFVEQESSHDVLGNDVLESHESNEQNDADSLLEGHSDGLLDDDLHVEGDLEDLGSDDVGMDNDLVNDDGLFDDGSHIGDDLDHSQDLDSSHDSDDVSTGGSLNSDDGFGNSTVDHDLSNDDDLLDDYSYIGDDLDHSQDLDSNHHSDDVGPGNSDNLGMDTDANNLSNDLDNDDGSSSDDVQVVAGSTTQACGEWKTYLSGYGTAEIEFEKERGETEVEIEVGGFAPSGAFPVTIGGVLVGQIRTDSRGRGELEYQISDDHYRPFPANFPVIEAGVTIQIDTQLSAGQSHVHVPEKPA